MSKVVSITLGRTDFELKSCKISEEGVKVSFIEKRVVKGHTETFSHEMDGDVIPHPDLIQARDAMKEYLMRSLNRYSVYEEAIKYLKGEQRQIVVDAFLDLCNETKVTGISISGQDHLVGVIIKGKEKNQMGGYSAMNSPRIVFSSDKLGYEEDVQNQLDIIENEIFAYLFGGKKAQKDLFDGDEDEKVETVAKGKKADKVVSATK